ncbi:cortical protein KAR9-domain-containing protein [Neurospora hispaniola]|uniref:Cortical protein KAR9-domain-containing protein n=1 Tax=Neurospora hispaniola TaxID=588809 RepID=A0AAJ0MUX0_9PEZI|nr:cortical protein KAR9-domain-containing protein [Neurospora hispaniola]
MTTSVLSPTSPAAGPPPPASDCGFTIRLVNDDGDSDLDIDAQDSLVTIDDCKEDQDSPSLQSQQLDRDTSSSHQDQQQRQDSAVELSFSEVPTELLQFTNSDTTTTSDSRPATSSSASTNNNTNHLHISVNHLDSEPPTTSSSSSSSSSTPRQSSFSTDVLLTPDPTPPGLRATRKPSPGLAARLKALGFGGQRKPASPPQHRELEIGKLPEETLKKLDEHHLSLSQALVIERRGRPWKGPLVHLPSSSSLKASTLFHHHRHKSEETQEEAEEAAHEEHADIGGDVLAQQQEHHDNDSVSTSPDDNTEMDTNKYRLPDHVNGNGVKAQPDTRHEHIARDSRPSSSQSSDDVPPPPPPKDTYPSQSHQRDTSNSSANNSSADDFNPDDISFNPLSLSRPQSVYTLSRASFANQLAQLTSITLPDAELLSNKIAAIPTAQVAARALIGAAEQIRGWIYKASEVIGGLEADDDVEWAAAGGREGVDEVEKAIVRFEELINIYVGAIEELQERQDINEVSTEDLRRAVAQMESIMGEWARIRNTLRAVKSQVELAMEWEELWNVVLGDIQMEVDDLSKLVFEMEERRHKTAMLAGDGVDIGDLETIVEEAPTSLVSRLQAANTHGNGKFGHPGFPNSPTSPLPTPSTGISMDDSSLLALFARMQPLRASLDFLPMRLAGFQSRAENIFPTASDELEMRRHSLEATYRKLEKDAESLRKELGEDRWVLVFRGAGRQAQKMYESVLRSLEKVKEAFDTGMHLTNQPMMSKRLESYEAKKTHYGPAIERVLSIIEKGVKDRLTVNGEILRLHNEMQTKWKDLKAEMVDVDMVVEELYSKGQQLRDSVSSILSDRSPLGSGHETPQSSPPSSVIMTGRNAPPTARSKSRQAGTPGSQLPKPAASRRQSTIPASASTVTRKAVPSNPRMSTIFASTPVKTDYRERPGTTTPSSSRSAAQPPRPSSKLDNRPRWNATFSPSDVDTGHNFKPLSLTTPSPYARSTSSLGQSSTSKLPQTRSPLTHGSDVQSPTLKRANATASKLSFRERISSPGPYSQQTLSKSVGPSATPRQSKTSHSYYPPSSSNTSLHSSTSGRERVEPPTGSGTSNMRSNPKRQSLQPPRMSEPSLAVRPASSMSTSRSNRQSMLPQPTSRLGRATTPGLTGRESPQAVAGARHAMGLNTGNTSAVGAGRRSGSSLGMSGGYASRSGSSLGMNAVGKDGRPRWRNPGV